MPIERIVPMLDTKDLDGTVGFYKDILGFTEVNVDPELGWASVKKDTISLMFSLPNAHLPFEKPLFTGSLYFYTDEVDYLWESLREKAQVCYELESFEYGMREFAIYDNNGYMLKFGQPFS